MMIRRVLLCLAVSSLASLVHADEDVVTLPQSGYQIKILDPGPAEAQTFIALQMLMPAKDGFASNVNVQHQPFPGTLEEFATISESDFDKADMTVIESHRSDEAYTVEVTGKVAGVDVELHFYIKAVKSAGNVILATATAPTSRWKAEKQTLTAVIDSLVPAGVND